MAYTLPRVGKSLVKFFKPIRVAAPHLPNEKRDENQSRFAPESISEDLSKGFRRLEFKKPDDKFAEAKAKVAAEVQEDLPEPQLPDKANGQWLELVVYLFSTCKRAASKMKKRSGTAIYKNALQNKNASKFQTRGSIINTTTQIIDDSGPDEQSSQTSSDAGSSRSEQKKAG